MSFKPSALLPDLSPWRSSRDFRLLWCSGAVTVFGTFLTFVALPLQLKELTGSTVAVGALGVAELVPLVVFGLYGGALADAVDRRRLLLWTEGALGATALMLLANSLLPEPMVWPLYAAAALNSALGGLQRPALEAIVPRVVPHEQLPAAVALNSVRWQIGGVAAPSLSGVLITFAGLEWAYAINTVTFAISVALARGLRPSPPSHGAARPSLRGIAEGARYAWSRKDLLGTYAVDLAATVLSFPIALFTFLADDLDAPWSVGLMFAAFPLGAAVVSATSGWVRRVHRHGRAVVLAAAGWGASMVAAGLAGNVWSVLLFLTVGGGCNAVSGIFRRTIWNQTIPDELRGRLAGIEMLSYAAGPQLGQIRAGGMAALTSVRFSVWGGGLACVVAVGLLALTLPRLMAYDVRTSPHAAAVRRAASPDGEADSGPAPTTL
ncbi:MFS transporter [Streptomyces megasporus]|uniref:MFS transporter n=1 Tax=Streptomyces megasporus TaxID=44060 RepID=UPI00056C7E73|nr:MFS transporter [Streptomyces megasporus]